MSRFLEAFWSSTLKFNQISAFLCLLLVYTGATAQTEIRPETFIPCLDTLKKALEGHFLALSDVELSQFRTRTKANFLNYLPSPGWNFSTNAPVLSWNLSELFSAVNARQVNKASVQAIREKWQAQYQAAWIEVQMHHQNLTAQIVTYNASLELLEIHRARFEITQRSYQSNEITPSDFLTAKASFLQIRNSAAQKYLELIQLRNELFIKSKKGDSSSLFGISPNVSIK